MFIPTIALATLLGTTPPATRPESGQTPAIDVRPVSAELATAPRLPATPAKERKLGLHPPSDCGPTPYSPALDSGCPLPLPGYAAPEFVAVPLAAYAPSSFLQPKASEAKPFIKPVVGFAYAQPRYNSEIGSAFMDPEDLNYDFVLSPSVMISMVMNPGQPSQYSIDAVGRRIQIEGKRTQVNPTGSVANLQVSNKLTIESVTFGEYREPTDVTEPLWGTWPCQRCFDFYVGPHYAKLHQEYSSTGLNGAGAAVQALSCTQDVSGFGITAAVAYVECLPCSYLGTPVRLYASARASVIFGDQQRNSTVQTAGAAPLTITESERATIPIGEFDAGVEWGHTEERGYGTGDNRPAVVGFRANLTAQAWGDVGYISAARPVAERFRSGDLVLFGASLVFWVEFGPVQVYGIRPAHSESRSCFAPAPPICP